MPLSAQISNKKSSLVDLFTTHILYACLNADMYFTFKSLCVFKNIVCFQKK
ncbi:hypothetical protein ACRRTK_014313 [Alexandromys fortis]